MKINEDIADVARNALRWVSTAEKHVVAKTYLAGVRMRYRTVDISDDQIDNLRRIWWFCCGLEDWRREKYGVNDVIYGDYAFAYGLQEGIRQARQCIDFDLEQRCKDAAELSPDWLAGYKAARASLGKYHFPLGGVIKPKREKA